MIQEVLLAQKVRLVCGTTSVDWETVTGIYLSCLEESQSNTVMLRRNELGYDIIKPFCQYHTVIVCIPRPQTEQNSLDDLSGGQGTCSYDLELLNLIRQRQCGRPVDKVYSILGLISGEVGANIAVDSSVDHWPLTHCSSVLPRSFSDITDLISSFSLLPLNGPRSFRRVFQIF